MTAIRVPPRWALAESRATAESAYWNRRQVVRALGLGGLAAAVPGGVWAAAAGDPATRPAVRGRFAKRFPAERSTAYAVGDDRALTPEAVASRQNNFYEFTSTKDKVWELAKDYEVDSWAVKIHGLVEREKTLDLDALFTTFPLEERLYRFRCVERWAMQVPWTGFPLAALVDWCAPLSTAKYVRFVTLADRRGMPGIEAQSWYSWPYQEALRIDEASHPLAFVATGIYGHALPMQFGAPWRLVLPWKYGYKSPKSIVEIEFTDRRPETFWNALQPEEYGFYSTVEPHKPHPRWSQRWEQDIGTGETRESLLYNGYAEQVASLYTGDEV